MSTLCRNLLQVRRLALVHQSKMPKSFLVTKDFSPKYFEAVSSKYDIDLWNRPGSIPRDELLKRSKGKDGIFLTLSEKVDEELLEAAGNQLKVISTLSVGYDHIDVEACRKRGIILGNTPGVLTDAMAELTVALTLATSRRFHEATRAVYDGQWPPGWNHFWMCGTSIKGSTIGFVGAGRIGSAVMKRLHGFEPGQVLYNTRNRYQEIERLYRAKHSTLEEVCSKSDIIIVICSLNFSTRNLIGREQFRMMKKSAVLINTSRGTVVDQGALYEALETKTIAAAGLDVMQIEPIPTDDPLLTLPNVLLLPHIGSADRPTREAMVYFALDNLVAGLEGKPMRASIY